MIQPPRGFGENPVAIYHDPDLPPSATTTWRPTAGWTSAFGADAVVHLGKHGTLEWLPGKGLGLSADCAPDAVLGDLPLVYPFIVNDPGEGTQAKRRGARHDRRPPDPADGPRRHLRRHRPAGAAARRVRDRAARSTRRSCPRCGRRSGRWSGPPSCTTTCTSTSSPTRPSSTRSSCTSTATCARSRTCRSATACTCWAAHRPGEQRTRHRARRAARHADLGRPGGAARPARRARQPRSASTRRRCWPTPARRWRCPPR